MSSKLKKLKHIIQEEIKLLKEQASKGIRIDVYKCEDSGYRQSWNNFCYNKESDMGPDIQIGDVFEIDQWPITLEPTRYFIKRIWLLQILSQFSLKNFKLFIKTYFLFFWFIR